MADKSGELQKLMKDVAKCRLCCGTDCGITQEKRLVNLIAARPNKPYGEIPTRYTDWEFRLNAKIAFVLQDWGGAAEARGERRRFEQLRKKFSDEFAWRHAVTYRPQSVTDQRIAYYLTMSAEKEGLELPASFLDHIFFTNAVMCFRKGKHAAGNKHIDLEKSIQNCCEKAEFLRRQLKIVNPSIVVALGARALKAFRVDAPLEEKIKEAKGALNGFLQHNYDSLPIKLVPLRHPTAHVPKGWTVNKYHERQIDEYRSIWTALSYVHGKALIMECCLK